jgi:hypothetical protein
VNRPYPARAWAFAGSILLASCAGRIPTSSLGPGPARTAERLGPWQITVALYDPALYGPELPLALLIRKHRLPLEKGMLKKPILLVNKAQRRLELWVQGKMIKAYRIQLGWNPHGPKVRQGDQKTPEGKYFICDHRPSNYHLALWLSYPNREDARRGLVSKLIGSGPYQSIARRLDKRECPPMDTRLGGNIVIHGQWPGLTQELIRKHKADPASLGDGYQAGDANPTAVREFQDWTDGCVALFNPDIREIYEFVPDGAEVIIVANGAITLPRGPRSQSTGSHRP